ncbi:hypothetical protein GQ53DRAFT_505452 [Thozetella sp. PMI_491]|nr:hypothetical protein GQ53DRAFT_505452 [Thozetella sp. PMI_491]
MRTPWLGWNLQKTLSSQAASQATSGRGIAHPTRPRSWKRRSNAAKSRCSDWEARRRVSEGRASVVIVRSGSGRTSDCEVTLFVWHLRHILDILHMLLGGEGRISCFPSHVVQLLLHAWHHPGPVPAEAFVGASLVQINRMSRILSFFGSHRTGGRRRWGSAKHVRACMEIQGTYSVVAVQ